MRTKPAPWLLGVAGFDRVIWLVEKQPSQTDHEMLTHYQVAVLNAASHPLFLGFILRIVHVLLVPI